LLGVAYSLQNFVVACLIDVWRQIKQSTTAILYPPKTLHAVSKTALPLD
jgi:hypothetical protein